MKISGKHEWGCPSRARMRNAGSLLTALVLTAVSAMVVLIVLPAVMHAHRHPRAPRINCVNNLKNVGLANRIFATDNSDQFPYTALSNQVAAGELTASVYFRWLSNELSTPKILICPSDRARREAADWTNLHATNISYFVGLNADEARPDSILGGDRNLTMGSMRLRTGVARGTNLAVLGWGADIHIGQGNILMGDGSVQQLSSQRLNAMRTNFLHNGEWSLLVP
jgi:prepilin-type processing-associated H-X9-DG protein